MPGASVAHKTESHVLMETLEMFKCPGCLAIGQILFELTFDYPISKFIPVSHMRIRLHKEIVYIQFYECMKMQRNVDFVSGLSHLCRCSAELENGTCTGFVYSTGTVFVFLCRQEDS
ncbi:hypothetical protein NDU88_005821 [Pleurodeles waltl]|uniref:Uncharacterized protein n=1 Tax=Pleurodeles waltl TaxID=8319 RepID=A0AAV7RLA0_PLEWA|nr:hypothetical protein NDU88_005821 [Pleurodeles waltl]